MASLLFEVCCITNHSIISFNCIILSSHSIPSAHNKNSVMTWPRGYHTFVALSPFNICEIESNQSKPEYCVFGFTVQFHMYQTYAIPIRNETTSEEQKSHLVVSYAYLASTILYSIYVIVTQCTYIHVV